ncbi:CocE/NonD family hydrolase [Thermomonospora cellulosilytica]|uniref:Putative CocE/NonD family hydrolase n=1 Tax=Thermomonospora cellulosilytica TaxID=1411118 RepID=A0A7W3RAD1_9ACTN|nr:CocE/NonD family hydrolase [Thermomonospora cellulosilytica]MBA9005175.1 putative CocE/NonD family hydrolase [Thermomonospora cellulosilytica]
MPLLSRVAERVLALPPAVTRDVEVRRGLTVPMPDGVELVADLYRPRRVPGAPTVLIRTPYGRGGLLGAGVCRPFAERGFQVLVQACRGTGGSGGRFDPFGHERADGLATLDWVEKQPWFNGGLLTFGPSYLGYTQWAMAADARDRITAMVPVVTASQFRDQTYLGDSYTLRGTLNWAALMTAREGGPLRALWHDLYGRRRALAAMEHLPLAEADVRATGRPVEWFRRWLESDAPDHPYWVPERDHRARVGEVTAPVHLVGGWHDLFLYSQLEDYAALRDAGRGPYLTIGPWTHSDRAGLGVAMSEALTWFRAHVTGDRRALRERPVRLYVQGAQEWRDYPEWPPPGTAQETWWLQPGGGLAPRSPAESAPSRFRYDPSDPTPGVGGPLLDGKAAGPKDNAALEARPDVLVFTGPVLDAPLEVVGPVTARIALRSSREHTDVFVRVCDVDPAGRSLNVCDGLQRVTPERFPADGDGVRSVTVRLWPTAYRFRAGHRLRVQVSSGSFPRFARNPGTGEPLGAAVRLLPADQEIFHDPARRSGVTFPVSRTL